MSEKDLDLKLATRRLYWCMGMSTRLNVKLSTHIVSTSSRSRTEEFTDLDVLGIAEAPDGRVNTTIGDCKTVKKAANERCFWLRGVSDFFDASSAHLVRTHDVPTSTRQLAERLRLGVLTEDDLAVMADWYARPIPEHVAILFDSSVVQSHQRLMTNMDSKLDRLLDYRNLGYWIVEPHRTIDGVVHHLNQASATLQPSDPSHVSLVFDMCWLFCLSLVHATSRIRETHASDVGVALKQFIFGGPAGLRDKENQAALVKKLTTTGKARCDRSVFEVVPDYFAGLLEVVTRHLRRPALLTSMLRYSEWLSLAPADKTLRGMSVATSYAADYDPVAGKVLGDTLRFLVLAAGLEQGFLTLAELTYDNGAPTQPHVAQQPATVQGVLTDPPPPEIEPAGADGT